MQLVPSFPVRDVVSIEGSSSTSENAGAWLLIGVVLIWGVGKAVFAPGRITYHRIVGAILLYLAIGLAFVSLHPARPAYPRCLHGHVHHR